MPPTVPINHYFGPRNQQNRTKVLFYYPMLMYSVAEKFACFEHSNLLKVKEPEPKDTHPVKDRPSSWRDRHLAVPKRAQTGTHPVGGPVTG